MIPNTYTYIIDLIITNVYKTIIFYIIYKKNTVYVNLILHTCIYIYMSITASSNFKLSQL